MTYQLKYNYKLLLVEDVANIQEARQESYNS
jgi:hypothetical protein